MGVRMRARQPSRVLSVFATVLLSSACGPEEGVEPAGSDAAEVGESGASDEAHVRGHIAGMAAHHICAGVFVVGRDYERSVEEVVAQDIRRFDIFKWQDDFEYAVNFETRTASVSGDGFGTRSAEYNGDQGCTVLPTGLDDVAYEPRVVERRSPDPEVTAWPTGDVGAYHDPPPAEVDMDALEVALDWTMAQSEHNTRALVVIYAGKILGERYAPGFTRNTPQISWSQGKSVASALVGAAIQAGHLESGLDDPAPVPEWQGPEDPRRDIRIRDILNMSSGLDFVNLGWRDSLSWTHTDEHRRIYFEGIDVFEHATDQPMDRAPGEIFRYRNSDPLTANRIVRHAVEARGEDWLSYPQRILFDRIGARNYVLETDAWGNFIISGYDYGSAWDWARFGLLHLWDGVWPTPGGGSDRILPEGWVDFVSTPAPGAELRDYGGLFWLNRGGSLPRAPEDAFWAAGFMGQYTAIIPSYDLVIVRLGPSPGDINAYLSDIIGEVTAAIDR
ncbi:serine hydrolase domain-containing protein [Candidatus Palauibacter sp.]|uniref:serine hydrolase domain-containing protein n=1 Tax=Candidatus Palauibacter sp. TaxID=3101350 RepID=UPI003B024059